MTVHKWATSRLSSVKRNRCDIYLPWDEILDFRYVAVSADQRMGSHKGQNYKTECVFVCKRQTLTQALCWHLYSLFKSYDYDDHDSYCNHDNQSHFNPTHLVSLNLTLPLYSIFWLHCKINYHSWILFLRKPFSVLCLHKSTHCFLETVTVTSHFPLKPHQSILLISTQSFMW